MATALLAPARTLTMLHSFSFNDWALPNFVTPTQGRDGNIYGTTSLGGSKIVGCLCGTAFNISPQGADEAYTRMMSRKAQFRVVLTM
jgi:hypothetical protein